MVATLLSVLSYFLKMSDAARERTFIMVKPDGVQRGLVGEIIKRFENRGYQLVAMKMQKASLKHIQEHYIDLAKKGFYAGLCDYMSSGPVVAMVWEGDNVVAAGRMLLGATNPQESLPGTIRGDFCVVVGRNICHGSDAVESAQKEIKHWFNPEELQTYSSCQEKWVYE